MTFAHFSCLDDIQMWCENSEIEQKLKAADRIWLFLDYDGTLAEFAPSPDHIEANPEIIGLITDLVEKPSIRLAVISGRSLPSIKQLLPVPGLLSAGTYGVEIVDFDGSEINRIDYSALRPFLESLKPIIEALIDGKDGFYLEDKGWSLALHARFASKKDADYILANAERLFRQVSDLNTYQILDGDRFLEICPLQADKGLTVAYLLEHYSWNGALPVYVGDDDKDERAFQLINQHGGLSIHVGDHPHETLAQCYLTSPQETRNWLRKLAQHF